MLQLLHIENIAVIEQADITFGKGFNVLTGETGAGKSIIIDAISAILGERTYREVIRTGADMAFVSAVFTGVPDLPWFEQFHVSREEELLIQREIWMDGRNVCRVNGQGVSVTALKALGRQLITIHGQHDSQQLFDEERHLYFLDAFAGDRDLLEEYAAAYDQVRRCRAEVDRLTLDEGEKARKQEMLRHQIQELEHAKLQIGEDERLEQRQRLLVNAERLESGVSAAAAYLMGDDDNDGAETQLSLCLRELQSVHRYDDQLGPMVESLRDLCFRLSDLSESLRDYRDGLSDAEEELDQIGARLDLIHKLRRKYGATCEDMLNYLDRAKRELDDIVFADERLQQAKKALDQATSFAQEAAGRLHEVRVQAARRMKESITVELAELNMPRVQFECCFTAVPLCQNGTDSLRFLMSANAGESLKPLSKVASGGELARVMLALKNVMARQDSVGTMIFDEVDSGVSGRAAQKVAEKLRQVAEGRQVLCVTHLPQIAALAKSHLLISKAERNGRTFTAVRTLDRDGRIQELARMIGGSEITKNTLRSAEEMLQ